MHEITTSIDVNAAPEVVWQVLTDFDSYDEWNPFMRIVGRANEGAHVVVELRPPNRRATTFRPELVTVAKPRELRWLGHLWMAGLFDGEHAFRIEELEDGTSRVHHSEEFAGLLAGLILRLGREDFEAGFEQMNAALKERAEAMAESEGVTVEGEASESAPNEGSTA
ncbi:SRPBCC domain-containing protein [Salinirubrum litoreum]|uniref:SRPBCC family protein n=1 Tax=Salinirubrum litoreum TaxID=1126234 RepID=A0ABD5R7C3_9EURY|nr:SRPBCC domain-containing protein [Salinirubrum litoreum]